MTENVRKVFAIVLVLVALASISVPAASAGTRQLWYLWPDAPNGHLEKTAPEAGTDTIPDDADVLFWNAGPVECPLTMGEGTWTLHLDYAPNDGGTCLIKVKHWSATNPHHQFTSATGNILSDNTAIDVDMTSTLNVDFIEGDYFMLVIQDWTPTTSGDKLVVNCGSSKSTLRGPASDPGFPVPELSSLVLFSVGLLALVGYVGYRRREIEM